MDIASGGLAASQISAGQRAQQISIAALRSAQLQTQSIVSALAESAAPAKTAAPAAGPAPASDGLGTGGARPSGNSQRGSLLNILA